MKTESVDNIKFSGQEKVLMAIDNRKISWLERIKIFLNKEIEVPITALALSCILIFSTISLQWITLEETYPIVVFESGGHYEIY